MDKGSIFAALMHAATDRGLVVRFCPLQGNDGRIKGSHVAVRQDMDINQINWTLAHELAHACLHYDKGDIMNLDNYEEYEEQADRAASMIIDVLAGL